MPVATIPTSSQNSNLKPVFASAKDALVPTANNSSTKQKTPRRQRSDKEIDWRFNVYEEIIACAESLPSEDCEKWQARAEKWSNCSLNPKTKINPQSTSSLPQNVATVWVCSDNPTHDAMVYSETCDNRGCPDCASRHTARLAARYVPIAKKLVANRVVGQRMRHIIMTTPICLSDDDVEDSIFEWFNIVIDTLDFVQDSHISKWHLDDAESQLGRSVRGKSYTWRDKGGAIISAEFGETGRMLHFHIIHYGEYISQRELSDVFNWLSGGRASVVWLRGITTDANDVESQIMEVVKYSTKFFKSYVDANGELQQEFIPPELMPKLMMVLDGTRRVRSLGVFYNIPEPDKEPVCCKQCDMPLHRLGVEMWDVYRVGGMDAVRFMSASDFSSATVKNLPLKYKLANKSEKPPDKVSKQLALDGQYRSKAKHESLYGSIFDPPSTAESETTP